MAQLSVAVVIPAHDAAPFIPRAIRSVFAQTQRPAEVIVVDDGSRDDTAEAVRRLGLDIVVLQQPNRGPGAARNAGVRACRSELVCFLDADDEYLPTMIATLSRALRDVPHADVASAAFFVKSPGRSARQPAARAIPASPLPAILKDYFAVARRHWIACTCSVIVRRRAFEAVGGFREDIRFGEDVDLWCRLAGRSDWVFVDEPVSIYHHHPSTSATLRTPESLWPTDILMNEDRMRECVRPELWASFRRYRRDFLLARARGALRRSAASRARLLLTHVAPAPASPSWMATWLLAHAPVTVGAAVLALNVRAREALRRTAPTPSGGQPGPARPDARRK